MKKDIFNHKFFKFQMFITSTSISFNIMLFFQIHIVQYLHFLNYLKAGLYLKYCISSRHCQYITNNCNHMYKHI